MTARYRVHDCTHDHLPNAPATRKVASNAGTWTWWAPELLRLHPDRKADATGQSSVPTPPPGARRLAEQVAASDGLRCSPRLTSATTSACTSTMPGTLLCASQFCASRFQLFAPDAIRFVYLMGIAKRCPSDENSQAGRLATLARGLEVDNSCPCLGLAIIIRRSVAVLVLDPPRRGCRCRHGFACRHLRATLPAGLSRWNWGPLCDNCVYEGLVETMRRAVLDGLRARM